MTKEAVAVYPKLKSLLGNRALNVWETKPKVDFQLSSGKMVSVLATNILLDKKSDPENFGRVRLGCDSPLVQLTGRQNENPEEEVLGEIDVSKWDHVVMKHEEFDFPLLILIR